MKVLVTGGGGFLGRYIVEKLVERGDEVSIFSRGHYPEVEALGVKGIHGDLRDKNAVIEACQDQEIVFHVASKISMWGKWKDFFEINVEGTQNIVDACLECGVSKLVYTSTASVVFENEDLENVDESTPIAKEFLSHYPKSKAMAEEIVLEANGKKGLITTILRPHLIWGPRDPSLAPRLIDATKRGRLRIIGEGKNKMDITYVDNVADAHLLAADSPKSAGQVYFIGQEEPVLLWDFLQKVFKRINAPPIKRKVSFRLAYKGGKILEFFFKLFHIYNKEPLITRFLASELAKSHYFNISKAKKELGYKPKVSMEEGLNRYVEYYLKNNE